MQYICSTPAKSNQKQTPTRAIFQESFCFSDNPFILLIKLRFTKVNKWNKYLRVDSKEKEGQGDKQQISDITLKFLFFRTTLFFEVADSLSLLNFWFLYSLSYKPMSLIRKQSIRQFAIIEVVKNTNQVSDSALLEERWLEFSAAHIVPRKAIHQEI